MDSLYGGRPGSPFVIKARFDSINQMNTQFDLGASYTQVYYGEYCIIDTPNKNDKNNGKIYRRGYTGAEYIGQIVGPKSSVPNMQLGTLKDIAERVSDNDVVLNGDVVTNSYRAYPTYNSTDNSIGTNWILEDDEYIDEGYNLTDSSGNLYNTFKIQSDDAYSGITSDVAIQSFSKDVGLVSGKENDSIRWNWCNIRLDGASEELDTWFYVGLEIPYPVVEIDAESISGYDDSGNFTNEVNVTERTEGEGHPYYYPFHIEVPRGIRGDSIRNIRHESISNLNGATIYLPEAFSLGSDGKLIVNSEKIYTIDENLKSDYEIWLYTLYDYSNRINGESYNVFIGVYNVLEKWTMGVGTGEDAANSGIITAHYTAEKDQILNEDTPIKWINDVSLSEDNASVMIIDYNNNEKYPSESGVLPYVISTSLTQDGTFAYQYYKAQNFQTGEPSLQLMNVEQSGDKLEWVEDFTLEDDHNYYLKYNDSDEKVKLGVSKEVQSIYKGTGNKIYARYMDANENVYEEEDLLGQLQFTSLVAASFVMNTTDTEEYQNIYVTSDKLKDSDVDSYSKFTAWLNDNIEDMKEYETGLILFTLHTIENEDEDSEPSVTYFYSFDNERWIFLGTLSTSNYSTASPIEETKKIGIWPL